MLDITPTLCHYKEYTVPNTNDDTVTGTPDDAGTWHTIAEACEILGVSVRTIRRRIEQGKVDSRLEDGRRMVLVTAEDKDSATPSATDTDDTVTGTPGDIPSDGTVEQSELIDQLKSEVEYLRKQLDDTNERHDQQKERSDTIIIQLTRQLEQSQLLLEDHSEPWYRRLTKRRGKPDNR